MYVRYFLASTQQLVIGMEITLYYTVIEFILHCCNCNDTEARANCLVSLALERYDWFLYEAQHSTA
jgi:hypothetical protein